MFLMVHNGWPFFKCRFLPTLLAIAGVILLKLWSTIVLLLPIVFGILLFKLLLNERVEDTKRFDVLNRVLTMLRNIIVTNLLVCVCMHVCMKTWINVWIENSHTHTHTK